MTLADFITSVCKEVFDEDSKNILLKNVHSSTKQLSYKQHKKLITESIVKQMILDGSIAELPENCLFTPLAKDMLQKYKKKR